ncbi:hypothetical protein [Chitinivorax sp. B]|uniref:hypothetical protein n=1 Tax=Chitinivorax sp. B TaxID=2502235 RepID=UPI0010F519EC|nr:hypothetical protein [Chitinivorax sp. B]
MTRSTHIRSSDILTPHDWLPRFVKQAGLAGAYFLLTFSANAADSTKWVLGSWVNVRQTADVNSPVIVQLITNTKVTPISQHDKSCEIEWSESRRGFVPCNLLGDKPLILAEIGNEYAPPNSGQKNPLYSPLRAFWIAPSAQALFTAGGHFHKRLLSDKQRHLENGRNESGEFLTDEVPQPKLIRYPVPEFDAMKNLLANGIVAPASMNPPLLSCKQMQQATANAKGEKFALLWPRTDYPNIKDFPYGSPIVHDCRVQGFSKLQLPAIRPSLFRSPREILSGNAGIEQVSAHFGILQRGHVTGGPRWEFRQHLGWHYSGAWDIGRFDLKLDKPIVEHVVGCTGLVGAYQWTPQIQFKPNGENGGCAEGLSNRRRGKNVLADYPAIKDPLLWFQAPTALPLRTAKISHRTETSVAGGSPEGILRAAVYEIDLNNDAIADFVQWDLWGMPEIVEGTTPILKRRIVFANIGGEWYPFESDFYAECT